MDDNAIQRLLESVRRDSGGAFITGLAYIGDKLGLFGALGERGPLSAGELAAATETDARYILEWLRAMCAFGYVEHDPESGTWWMTAEQTAVLADEHSPFLGVGTFQFALPSLTHTDELIAAFRNGGGIGYDELHPEIAPAIDRMHRAWFEHLLTQSWLPAIPTLEDRLNAGIRVLDVGCGLGRSTAALARAYPASTVVGIDPHGPSAAAARDRVAHQSNSQIIKCTLESYPTVRGDGPENFDLILAIDCIHDMPDPVGALRAIRPLIADDGLFVWSEPSGSPDPIANREDSLARVRSALSPYHCLTVSLAAGGAGLGTLIGEEGARKLADEAGYADLEVLPVDSPVQAFFGLRG